MPGEIIQYQTEDGVTVIRLQASDGSVWLSQADMAELFQGYTAGDHPAHPRDLRGRRARSGRNL